MNQIIILPIILPLAFTIIMLLIWKSVKAHRYINLAGSTLLLIVSVVLLVNVISEGMISLQVGGWQSPVGISIVADYHSTVMVVITAVIGFATALYSLGTMDEERERYLYYPLLQLLITGINGAFLTGDIFNLYVWFEVMLISSFVLLALGGVYKYYPIIGLLFLIPALSLAGIPPLSGFWAKFVVIRAGLDIQEYLVVGVALLVGLLTLFSMTKIWNEVFWKDDPKGSENHPDESYKLINRTKKYMMIAPIVFLTLITIVIGFYAEPFFIFANDAAKQLMNPSIYINTVLGIK